jgi:transposase
MSYGMKKKAHSSEFKFKVAIEAIRGMKTSAEICAEYGVVSSQIFKWKKAVLDQGADVFKNGISGKTDDQVIVDKLHATILRLTVENHFLEKCLGRSR